MMHVNNDNSQKLCMQLAKATKKKEKKNKKSGDSLRPSLIWKQLAIVE